MGKQGLRRLDMKHRFLIPGSIQIEDSGVVVDERVSAVESESCFQVPFRELVLSLPQVIKCQVLMRIRKPGIEADGTFIIFVGRVDAAEFGFRNTDKILERGIPGPQAPGSLKLVKGCLVFPLLKERHATLQRIALP